VFEERGMKQLSDKQSRIINYLHRFLHERGYPPTIRDIQGGCQISSTSVVEYNLRILEREGYLRRDREVSRGIELGTRRVVRVPIIGHIAAGEPIPVPTPDTWNAEEIDSLELTEELTRGRERVYALKVKGTSMIDAANDEMPPIYVDPKNVAIQGRVIGVIRRL